MKIINCGDTAMLIELNNMSEAISIAKAIKENQVPGIAEVHATGNSVLITYIHHMDEIRTETALRRLLAREASAIPSVAAEIAALTFTVTYNGSDVGTLADQFFTSAADIVGWHSGAEWIVEVCADQPGLWYLSCLSTPLAAPTTTNQIIEVAPGAILTGEGYTAIHTHGGPTKWHLLGYINDVADTTVQSALDSLAPGVKITFVNQERRNRVPQRHVAPAASAHSQ